MDKKVQDILSKMTLEDKISLCNGADFWHSKAMAQYGIPGLKFNAYHARGFDIDGTKYKGTAYDVKNMDGETHYEYSVGTSYAIQSGPLKATAIRATYTTHRASKNQSDGNINEFRLVTTIPFNIL